MTSQNLDAELHRVATVCHECRLCFNLCDTFPKIFSLIDAKDGEVEKVSPTELAKTAEDCFECKLCYPKCPYTPPHRFQINFPELMQEVKNREASTGIPLQDRLLSHPVLMGSLGSLAAPLMNRLAEQPLFRLLLEKTTGIHRERKMPTFYAETLDRWMRRHKPASGEPVVLFGTCFVNFHRPQTGKAAVFVLEKLGFSVLYPKQHCCGMPALDVGDLRRAKAWAKETINSLYPLAQEKKPIVCPGPSCSLMLKQEIPRLLPDDPRAQTVSSATKDLCEFLTLQKEKLIPLLTPLHRDLAYHFPCHLRVQNIGPKSRDLLSLISPKVKFLEECSAMDGTWGLKARHYAQSRRLSSKLTEKIEHESIATDCPLAGLQLAQTTGRQPKHPIEYLAEALQSKPMEKR